MKKKTAQSNIELTDNPKDKDPHHKKQQKATAKGSFKEKNLKEKIQKAHILASVLKARNILASVLEEYIDKEAKK